MTDLETTLRHLESQFSEIPPERKVLLHTLGEYLNQKQKSGETARVNFICTHNSRRSQIAQLWLLAAADFFKYGKLEAFSGGTEATEFHPNAVAAMQRAGFALEKKTDDSPSGYRWNQKGQMHRLWSKVFSDPPNPRQGFAAVMVCSDADEACPFVPGAEKRISLPFEDPKKSDGSGREKEAYDQTAEEIGREISFAVWTAVSID